MKTKSNIAKINISELGTAPLPRGAVLYKINVVQTARSERPDSSGFEPAWKTLLICFTHECVNYKNMNKQNIKNLKQIKQWL